MRLGMCREKKRVDGSVLCSLWSERVPTDGVVAENWKTRNKSFGTQFAVIAEVFLLLNYRSSLFS
jgi:hypothetical protein